MKERSISTVVLLLVISCLAAAQGRESDCTPEAFPPRWSAQATYLCSWATKRGFARDVRIYSPDGTKAVHVINQHWFVEIEGRKLRPEPKKSYVSDYPAELLWSPDSTAFYITQSDGTSEIQGFHTEIYRLTDRGVRQLPNLDLTVHRQFDHRHKCVLYFAGDNGKPDDRYEDDYSNVAGLKWVEGSSELILVAEIAPDQACGEHRGYFGGYLLSTVNGRILRRYSPQELLQEWGGGWGFRLKNNYTDLNADERAMEP